MKKYRLTLLGKIVIGGLLIALVSASAYGFERHGSFIENKAKLVSKTSIQTVKKMDKLTAAITKLKVMSGRKQITTKAAVQSHLSASEKESVSKPKESDSDVNFNLKQFLQYMPVLSQATINEKNMKGFSKNVEIFYAPHPDDELLSMGAGIAESVKVGKETHVVLYSHGYETNAINFLNGNTYCSWHKRIHNPTEEGYEKLSEQDIGKLRVDEFEKSVESLGVKKENVHILNFDADRMTEYEVMLIILGFEKQFPGATHNTASYHDIHQFHRKLGKCLLKLYQNKEVANVRFFISPVQWNSVHGNMIASNDECKTAISNSEKAYKLWEPGNQQFGIGYHSYPQPFIKLEKMWTSKWHNPNE